MATTAAATTEASRRPRSGRIPHVVWWITGLHFVLMVVWGVATPIFHATDEPNQFDAVMYVRDNHSWPKSHTTRVQPGTVRSIAQSPFGSAEHPYSFSREPITERTPTPRAERRSFREMNGPMQGRGGLQQLTQHPPGYYFLGAALMALTPGASGWHWDQQVGYLRIFSAVLLAPMPLLAWASARRLTDRAAPAVTAALIPLTIPAFEFMGGTVNNDVLITALAAPVTYLCVRVMTGDVRWRTVIALGVFEGLACLAKIFSVALLPLMALAFLLVLRRGVPWREMLTKAATSFAVAFLCGGWWWLLTLIRYGSLTANNGEGGVKHHTTSWIAAKVLARRWWSYLGWSDATFDNRTVLVLTVVAGIGVLAGVLLGVNAGRERSQLLVLLVPVVLLYAFVLHRYAIGWLGTGARYAYAALPAIFVAIALGWGRLFRRRDWVLPGATVLIAAFLEVWAFKKVLHVWWRASAHGSVSSFKAWSPWPEWVLYLVAVVSVLVTVGALIALVAWTVREARRVGDGLNGGYGGLGPGAPVAVGVGSAEPPAARERLHDE